MGAGQNGDRALSEFLQAFDDKKRKETHRATHELKQIDRKRQQLTPIRELLQQFVEMGLVIASSKQSLPGAEPSSTQKFKFYEGESSPAWGPGVSLFFDHPIEVEIAIPNDLDLAKMGAVVISCVTTHRDKAMLERKFNTIEAAKDVLARFLGKNAISIEHDPRRVQRAERVDAHALDGAPNQPPES